MEIHYTRLARYAAELEKNKQFDKAANEWHRAWKKAKTDSQRHWCNARIAHCKKQLNSKEAA